MNSLFGPTLKSIAAAGGRWRRAGDCDRPGRRAATLLIALAGRAAHQKKWSAGK